MPSDFRQWLTQALQLFGGPVGQVTSVVLDQIKKRLTGDPQTQLARELGKQFELEVNARREHDQQMLQLVGDALAHAQEMNRELVLRQQANLPAVAGALESLTVAERRKITLGRRTLELEDARRIKSIVAAPSEQGRQRLQRVFRSLDDLQGYMQAVAEAHGILVVPSYLGADVAAERTFLALMYQARDIRAAGGAQPIADIPGHGAAFIPELIVADDLAVADLPFTPTNIADLRLLLAGVPTICIQVVERSATIQAWWWLPGDSSAQEAHHSVPHDPMSVVTTAQLVTLLLSDALSLGGFEGAAAVPRAISRIGADTSLLAAGDSSAANDLLKHLTPWYMDVCAAYGDHYGPLGVVTGLPVSFQADGALLQRLRTLLLPYNFAWASIERGGAWVDGWSLMVVARALDDREQAGTVFVLAARRRDEDRAYVRSHQIEDAVYPEYGWSPHSVYWRDTLQEGIERFTEARGTFSDLGLVDISPRSADLVHRMLAR